MMRYILLFLCTLVLSGSFLQGQEKVVIKGSDTLGAKVLPQLKERYMQIGNEVDFEIAAEGSSQAFSALMGGTADIGMSSRPASDREKNAAITKGKELVEHVAGWDMVVVVVNARNGVRNLSLEQLEGIFTGDIQDWSEVGGRAGRISVYTRNTASGTYKSFRELAMSSRDYGQATQKMAGNEQVATEVAGNPNGIGYVGLAFAAKKGLRKVRVDGNRPHPRFRDRYPLTRKLYFYTVGKPTGASARFLNWVDRSPAAQEVIRNVGFIPAK